MIARITKTGSDSLERDIAQIRADVFADLLAGVDPTLAGAASPAPRRGGVLQIISSTLGYLDDPRSTMYGYGLAPVRLAAAVRWLITDSGGTWSWTDDAVDCSFLKQGLRDLTS